MKVCLVGNERTGWKSLLCELQGKPLCEFACWGEQGERGGRDFSVTPGGTWMSAMGTSLALEWGALVGNIEWCGVVIVAIVSGTIRSTAGGLAPLPTSPVRDSCYLEYSF